MPLTTVNIIMRLRLLVVPSAILLLATVSSAEQSAPRSDRDLVAAFQTGKEIDADVKFLAAVRRLDELSAELEFDAAGNLVGVDLASGRKSAADADVVLLPALRHLKKLRISGGEVTNAAAERLATIAGLAELALLNSQIDDAGFRLLSPLVGLTAINIQRTANMTDEGLEHLKNFPKLVSLGLGDNSFTDRVIPRLQGLANLKIVDLRGCSQITDAGIGQLRSLKSLRGLRLGGYAVTDATLAIVAGFPNLATLAIEESSVSNAGLRQIQDLPIEATSASSAASASTMRDSKRSRSSRSSASFRSAIRPSAAAGWYTCTARPR